MVSYRKPDPINDHLRMCKKYLRTQIQTDTMMDAWRRLTKKEISEKGYDCVLESLSGQEMRLKMVVFGWNNLYAHRMWDVNA